MTSAVVQFAASGVSLGLSIAGGVSAGKGLSASRAASAPGASNATITTQGGLAQSHGGMASSYGAMGSAVSGLGQSASTTCNAVGGLVSGLFDADIAIKDGESQAAGMRKDTTDKLRQKATELVQAMMTLLQSVSQADYQTMTAIGRV
jgi:hypothetical protein